MSAAKAAILIVGMSWSIRAAAQSEERPDVIALVTPAIGDDEPAKERESKPPVREVSQEQPPASKAIEGRFHVGLKAAPVLASGRFRAGFLASAELGLRLPMWQARLGLMIEPGFGVLTNTAGMLYAQALWFDFPLLVSYHERLGSGRLRVVAGASINWLRGQSLDRFLAVSGWAPLFDNVSLSAGLNVGAGWLVDLRAGSLSFEFRYRFFGYTMEAEPVFGHNACLSVGYAFFFL